MMTQGMTRLEKIKQVHLINQQIHIEDMEFEDRVLKEKIAELERLRDRIVELVALGSELTLRKLPMNNLRHDYNIRGEDKNEWTSMLGFSTYDSGVCLRLRVLTNMSSMYIHANAKGDVLVEYSYSNHSNFYDIAREYWEDAKVRATIDEFIDSFPLFETKVFDYIDNQLKPNKRKHPTTVVKE